MKMADFEMLTGARQPQDRLPAELFERRVLFMTGGSTPTRRWRTA